MRESEGNNRNITDLTDLTDQVVTTYACVPRGTP